MLETIVGDNGSRFIIAAGAVAIGLLCLVAVLWIMRRRPSSPFVRGGKNRQPRLAVLDAAAVDTRRRLVLIRRDDVEHLIMIGGPTDIVIESRIMLDTAAPESARPPEPQRTAEPRRPIEAPVATRPEVKPQSVAMETVAAEPVLQTRAEPARPAPEAEPAPTPELPSVPRFAPPIQPAQQSTFNVAQAPAPAISYPLIAEPRQEMSGAPRDRGLPRARQTEEERPAQAGQTERRPAAQPQPSPVQVAPPEKSSDFERMLDAEISSDLQRLAPTVTPRPQVRPTANVRQEPVLGAASADARKEPSIDEEMTRMLADISAGRKP
jgi:hypothetical protein